MSMFDLSRVQSETLSDNLSSTRRRTDFIKRPENRGKKSFRKIWRPLLNFREIESYKKAQIFKVLKFRVMNFYPYELWLSDSFLVTSKIGRIVEKFFDTPTSFCRIIWALKILKPICNILSTKDFESNL